VYRGFDDVKVLVDVGGGLGASLEQITKRLPHIKGVNFDQAHVIEASPKIPGIHAYTISQLGLFSVCCGV